MNKIKRVNWFIAGVAGALLLPHHARAAEAAAEDTGTLQEIIVTAEKREESSQKTPISLELYTSAEIDKKGIVDLASLATNDTSLNFNSGGGEGYLTLRGVSSHDTTEVGSPSVPVSVDGFVSIRPWTLGSSLYDLARIEVLRGPQGTLYGRSATGGLINIISNKPTKDFEASAGVEYGNYNALNVTGMLNAPVSDRIQIRVAFSSRRHDGYRTSPTVNGDTPDKGDDEDSRAARLQVAIQPTDQSHALFTYEDTHIGGTGTAVKQIPFAPSSNLLAPAGDPSHALPNLGSPYTFDFYGSPFVRVDSKIGKWNLGYDGLPGDFNVTYLGGFGLEEWHHSSPSGNLFSFLYGGPANFTPFRAYLQNEEPHTQNHELRFTSASTGPLSWQGGLYYFKEDNNLFSHEVLNPGFGGNPSATPSQPAASDLYQFIFPSVAQTSKAVYGQAGYQVTDSSKLSAGARYSKDEITRRGIFNLYLFGLPGISEYGHADSHATTWHVGYDWSPTPFNLLYAKADTGYKPGGFGSAGCPDYTSEHVTSFEVGSKNRFDDSKLQFNVAAFLNNYKDQQVSAFTSQCTGGTSTVNAGKSKIYGLEADVTALAGPVGKFDASLSYLHARFESFLVPPTVYPQALFDCARVATTAAGSNCQLAGNTLTQSPNVTVAVGFEHGWDLPDTARANFRIEGKYTSKQYFDAFNYADTTQPGFAIGNAYLDYNRDKWSVGLYIRNFTNKVYLNNATEQSGFGESEYTYSYAAPRTFGLRATVSVK